MPSNTKTRTEWERDITDLLIDLLEISNGDAQGIVECHPFELAQEWAKGSTPQAAADRLAAPEED